MSAKECPACDGNGGFGVNVEGCSGLCETCNGTGRVWPSVEGEIVVEECAYQLHTESIDDGNWALDIDVPGPGFYRIIVQPIEDKEG